MWKERGEIEFNDFGITHSAFNSAFAVMKNGAKYKVATISVDEYVGQTGCVPNVIKIDSEHAEYEILMGMKETMTRHRPVISMEVSDCGQGKSSSEALELALARGYMPMEFKGQFQRHQIKGSYVYDNLLLFPSD